jgi:hypothetical protein
MHSVLRNQQQGRSNAAQPQASPPQGLGGAGGFLGGINPAAIQSTLTNFFGTRVIQPQPNFGGQPDASSGLSFGQPGGQSVFANPADNFLGNNRQ